METFVVRIWTPSVGTGDEGPVTAGLRGTVDHVGTGLGGSFSSEGRLLQLIEAFLVASRPRAARACRPAGGERIRSASDDAGKEAS